MTPVRVIALLLTLLALGACSRGTELNCGNNTQYRAATSTGTLRIPDDLSAPDESDSLRIPGSSAAVAETGDGALNCLEESPAFSSEPQQP